MILLVSKDHVGRLVNAQFLLKFQKKESPGFMALFPKPSTNEGIYTIFTHVTVVPFCGTNGLSSDTELMKFHLPAHHVNDNVIVYIHAHVYVCVVSAVRFCTGFPSHQSTVYEL